MLHKLKIKEKYYELVQNGTKPFEIRKNDRNFQVGDIVSFIPVNDNGSVIPHDQNKYMITYVFNGGEYGLSPEYCVFGILQMGGLSEDVVKQGIDNCYMAHTYEHPGYEEDRCAGLRTLNGDGEPVDECKECALYYGNKFGRWE